MTRVILGSHVFRRGEEIRVTHAEIQDIPYCGAHVSVIYYAGIVKDGGRRFWTETAR